MTTDAATVPDWPSLRALFPVLKEYAYFGWAATSPLSTRSADAMVRHVTETRNEGAAYYREWYQTYEAARRETATLINASPDEIALLKNTSECLSTVASGLNWKSGDNLILPRGEFPSNTYPWLALRERGVQVRRIDPDEQGRFTVTDVERLVDNRTRLVALSWVNYSTGFRTDLTAIGQLCRERGIFFSVDAIQGLGVLPMDVATTHVDALSADGHKWLCAPEGLAVFYLRRDWFDRVQPATRGWWSVALPSRFDLEDQPLAETARRYECGTLPTTNCYGLREALNLLNEIGVEQIAARIRVLTDDLVDRLSAKGVRIVRATGKNEWSGIVSFAVPDRDPRQLAAELERDKIIVTPRSGRLRVAVHAWNDQRDFERLIAAIF